MSVCVGERQLYSKSIDSDASTTEPQAPTQTELTKPPKKLIREESRAAIGSQPSLSWVSPDEYAARDALSLLADTGSLSGDTHLAHTMLNEIGVPRSGSMAVRLLWVADKWLKSVTHPEGCCCRQCTAARRLVSVSKWR